MQSAACRLRPTLRLAFRVVVVIVFVTTLVMMTKSTDYLPGRSSFQKRMQILLRDSRYHCLEGGMAATNLSRLQLRQMESQLQFTDKLFKPILEEFRNSKFYANRSNFRSGSKPKIFLVSKMSISNSYWKNSLQQIENKECPFQCTFTDNKKDVSTADAVLVYFSFFENPKALKARLPERDPTQPWIAFSVETPCHYLFQKLRPFSAYNGIFNRTMTYRRDSDIVFTHGFIVSKEDAKVLPPSWVTPMQETVNSSFSEKKVAAVFTSHCKTLGGRMEYIQELRKYVTVDIYGKCGSFACSSSRYIGNSPHVKDDECLLKVAKNYLFYLSFENSIAKDYVTEKVYNILFHPIVPVVFGGANYSDVLPPGSYIRALDYKPVDLAKRLVTLAGNESEYNAMLEWRKNYQVSTVGTHRIYCDLCAKLHQPEFMNRKVYEDFQNWFDNKSSCVKYTKGGLEPIP